MSNNISQHEGAPPKDLGFGTTATSTDIKLINKDGTFNVRRKGLKFHESFHFYHYLITIPWWKFHVIIFSYFLVANLIFSSIFMFIGVEHIGGMIANTWWEKTYETFFFSAQTLTTVGYGRINPIGFAASALAAVESMLGLMGFALITGVLYGRFSRPDTNILFSKNALISPYKNVNAIMFRMANLRQSQLIETEVQFVIGYNKIVNGTTQRAFDTLALERDKINFFPLSWTIVHPLDDNSDLRGFTVEDFKKYKAEFTVSVKAFDDTFHQQVYARYSYSYSDMISGHKFVRSYNAAHDGVIEMDFEKFHLFEEALLN